MNYKRLITIIELLFIMDVPYDFSESRD